MEGTHRGWEKARLRWWGVHNRKARAREGDMAKNEKRAIVARFWRTHSGGTCTLTEGTYWGWEKVDLMWWGVRDRNACAGEGDMAKNKKRAVLARFW
jgi:hypothetical protein